MTRFVASVALLTILWAAEATAQEADLRVDGSAIYDVDGSVRVIAAVTNSGPDDLLDVDITAQFDTATATASQLDAGCSGSSIGVVCSFSSLDTPVLASGDELVVEFVVTPSAGATDLVFTVRSSATDPLESDNTDTVALIPSAEVDIAVDERGIDAGRRKTLVFTVSNHGPDTATNVAVRGSVTVNFTDEVPRDGAEARTGIESATAAVCGRQIPNSDGVFDRWTFPVSCSIDDLAAGEEVEFRFWFESGTNAQFRVSATSDNLDTDHANDVTDGTFANSPIDVVASDADAGGCASAGGVASGWWPAIAFAALAARKRRKRVLAS